MPLTTKLCGRFLLVPVIISCDRPCDLRCAECLGLLGPLDPTRISVESKPPNGLIDPGAEGLPLALVSAWYELNSIAHRRVV